MRLDALIGPDAVLAEDQAAVEITGLTADSREVAPGFLFAALRGVAADGSAFIPMALARGAAAVLADASVAEDAAQGTPLIRVGNPRQVLARAAARFHGLQPDIVVAVTGTNGKTSVVSFTRQIWEAVGLPAASIGTVGIVGPKGDRPVTHTTPDPVALHALLADLAEEGASHVAIEASSHGLAQYRLDGVRIAAGAFTNISRDHLDYHPTFEDYFAAKCRLFTELLPEGSAAVVNTDTGDGARIADAARGRGLIVHTVGRKGSLIRLLWQERQGLGQRLKLVVEGREHEVFLPLVGDFQASNALVAAGLVIAAGGPAETTVCSLDRLKGARGRLELVSTTPAGASAFVDYAHTPDALDNAIRALRPYTEGRLIVVFGAGGDRDPGKRPLMGEAVARLADIAIVTDDNPRSEDPAEIRRQVLASCPGGIDGGDRARAIRRGMGMLGAGDVLLIAGKGHERGQEIGGEVIAFSDQEEVVAAARELDAREAVDG